MEVAQAQLADVKDKLNKLLAGADPRDVASAMAKLQAAQSSADSLMIRAPFDGEILQVNYQAGDAALTSNTAIVLANRTKIYIEVLVDESEVTRVKLGSRATVTANPLPDVKIDGIVSRINTIGVVSQGLTKYGVRVDVTKVDPRLLTGMTATVSIITSVNNNALAVPLDAVQNDSGGEYVNRVVNGVAERVNVKSGQLIEDMVLVAGDLKPGELVQLVRAISTTTTQFGGTGWYTVILKTFKVAQTLTVSLNWTYAKHVSVIARSVLCDEAISKRVLSEAEGRDRDCLPLREEHSQ